MKIIFIFLFYIMGENPLYAEEILMGRLPDGVSEYFTIYHFLRSFLFLLIIISFFSLQYFQKKTQKSFLASIVCLTFLTLVSPSPSEFISIFNFVHFDSFSILVSVLFLSCSFYTILEKGSFLDTYKDKKNLLWGISGAFLLLITLFAFTLTKVSAYLLIFSWVILSSILTIWVLTQAIKQKADPIQIVYIGLLWGAFFGLGTGGNEHIMGIALRSLGWVGCYFSLGRMLVILYKKHIHISLPKEDPLPLKKNTTEAIKEEDILKENHLWIQFDPPHSEITISNGLMTLLNLGGVRKQYSLEHFKPLIIQKDQEVFVKTLMHPNDRHTQTFQFYGLTNAFSLHRIYLEQSKNNSYFFSLVETAYENENITNPSRDPIQTIPPSNHFLKEEKDFKYYIRKEAMQMRNKQGYACLIIIRITNYDTILYETNIEVTNEIIKKVHAILNQKMIMFPNIVTSMLSSRDIGFFFYSQNERVDIENVHNITLEALQFPIHSTVGNVFVYVKQGGSCESTEKILYDPELKIMDTLFSQSYKNLFNTSVSSSDCYSPQHHYHSLPQGSSFLPLATQFRYAPENHQIDPYFSFILDSMHKNIMGCDVHINWNHPDHRSIYGDALSSLLEYTKMHVIIEKITALKAIKSLSKWQETLNNKHFFIEITISQEGLKGFLNSFSDIATLVQELKISPKTVHFIFEKECLFLRDIFLNTLNILNRNHYTATLKEFGKGEAGLSSLIDFPIYHVLFDKEYGIKGIKNERSFYALASTLKTLKNMNVVASLDGVEDINFVPLLHKAGITYVKGGACGEKMFFSGIHAYLKNYMQTQNKMENIRG